MDQFTKIFFTLLVRSFVPANPFYINYMVDTKAFTSKELSNLIAPYFFYSSFLGFFLCKSILHYTGIAYSSAIVSLIYLFSMVVLLILPRRNLFIGRLVYFSSGFASSFDIVLRFYISESSNNQGSTDSKYSYLNMVRSFSVALSCFVGQEVVQRTGYYEINIYISLFTQLLGFCLSSLIAVDEKKFEFVDINMYKALVSMDKSVLKAFLASCISNSFHFFIKFFSQSIFRDKILIKKTVPKSTLSNNKFIVEEEHQEIIENKQWLISCCKPLIIKIVKLPINLIAIFFIKIILFVFPKYKDKGNVQTKFLNGNLDALISIFCYSSSYFIVILTKRESKELLYFSLLVGSSCALLFMTKIHNRYISLFVCLAIVVSANTCTQISKGLLKKTKNDNNLVVACFIVEIILHSAISQCCNFFKTDCVVKSQIYSLLGIIVSIVIVLIHIT